MRNLVKTKSTFLMLGIIGFLSLISSCYYDSLEELDPNFGQIGNCDTSGAISFSTQVNPIVTTFCGSTGGSAASCHGNSSASGIPLVTHFDISNAASNNMMDAIRQINGASPMPKGGGKLDNCRIVTIQKWIDEGKLNN